MQENVALDKKFQSKFARKVKKAKERVKSEGTLEKTTPDKQQKNQRGLVYVGHIPHGFYEKEMMAYFKQFGKVSNLQVCRSKSTGQSKGYAFVEFANSEVAKVAAETMDNYLMFNRRLIAKYRPVDPRLRRTYKGPGWSKNSYPLKGVREDATLKRNKNIDDATHLKKSRAMISTINKSLKKLQELGINYRFQAVDDYNDLNKNILQANSPDGQQSANELNTDVEEAVSGAKLNGRRRMKQKKNVGNRK